MTFIFLGLLIFCAHLFNAWFSRQRIPDVLLRRPRDRLDNPRQP